MEQFADRLCEAIRSKGTPAMVGIDPRWEMLPSQVQDRAIRESDGQTEGNSTLETVAAAYRIFVKEVIEQVAELVPIVKFQAAFFEMAGAAGMRVLAESIEQAKQAGLLVIFDGKRGDIGSTAEAYAQAYLGEIQIGGSTRPVWSVDAMTVHPYLGTESLEPFRKEANRRRAGLFVLVRTSNPGAGELQDQKIGDRTVCQSIADWVEQSSAADRGQSRYGPIGAVVGATAPEQIVELRRRMPHAILLVPGYGAQGGTAGDIAAAFDADGMGAIVNSSRGILYAFRNPKYAHRSWQDAIFSATGDMTEDLSAHTPAGRLRDAL